ncbi:unnamed protein product [Haemonchus placei]|uniref:7TM_GPCR_Srx domain-containing protein n=1 Tax=Haemonchus placei TaxID=6290 RepID=A0A0N4VW32_HAEPC|nr:unnamed protein product [Haemonchus placei]
MMIGMALDIAGLVMATICILLPTPYTSLFVSTVIHINAGIANFLCIIVFMSAVSKEVGNKIHPASEMDDPLFHFEYGFSFILLKSSFLLTELAALFSIVVYMAKRDERTFNRYKIRSLLNFCGGSLSDKTDSELIQESCNNAPTRYKRGRRAGICSPALSDRTSLDIIASPPSKRSDNKKNSIQQPGALFLPGFGTSGFMRNKSPENVLNEDDDVKL